MRLHLRASIKPTFENHILWPALPLQKAKKRQRLADPRLWVHVAEKKFGSSPHPFAPPVKRAKQNLKKKVFFRDTLMCNLQMTIFFNSTCLCLKCFQYASLFYPPRLWYHIGPRFQVPCLQVSKFHISILQVSSRWLPGFQVLYFLDARFDNSGK